MRRSQTNNKLMLQKKKINKNYKLLILNIYILTVKSLDEEGRCNGFFFRHNSTKCRNVSVHSDACKIGVSF